MATSKRMRPDLEPEDNKIAAVVVVSLAMIAFLFGFLIGFQL